MIIKLMDMAKVIRSKNSGPYMITFDIIFKDDQHYQKAVKSGVFNKDNIAVLYGIPLEHIVKIVEYEPSNAIKITMVRQNVAGQLGETDIYGAQQHAPFLNMTLDIMVS